MRRVRRVAQRVARARRAATNGARQQPPTARVGLRQPNGAPIPRACARVDVRHESRGSIVVTNTHTASPCARDAAAIREPPAILGHALVRRALSLPHAVGLLADRGLRHPLRPARRAHAGRLPHARPSRPPLRRDHTRRHCPRRARGARGRPLYAHPTPDGRQHVV
eukprot:5618976-Prymnesium_polylepis.4